MDKNTHKKKKSPKKKKIIILSIVGFLLAILIGFGIFAFIQVNNLKTHAYAMKDALSATLDYLKEYDANQMERCITTADNEEQYVKDALETPFWKSVEKIPLAQGDISSAKKLMDIYDEARETILRPLLEQLHISTPKDLKVGEDGYNAAMILDYLDLVDRIRPDLARIAPMFNDLQFRFVPIDLEKYTSKFEELNSLFEIYDHYKPLLTLILGGGNDRFYLLMAQNSAEMRASGGFPGAMGTIEITNGVLYISDFSSVYNHLNCYNNDWDSGITAQESNLFRTLYTQMAHDACFNPDFSRVGEITKVAFDKVNDADIDGVISLTPSIIQRILAATDQKIELSDGTIVDSTNATLLLQRDLYYKYQGSNDSYSAGNDIIDELFAETAKGAMKAMAENLKLETLPKLLELFEGGAADRTIQIWMADEEEEELIKSYGCSGKLNYDPNKPEAGVFFSNSIPSKLGIYIDIYTEITSSYKNEDGENVYEIKVTLNNNISEENSVLSAYITGGAAGMICGYLYFFAPCGGYIYDFEASDGMWMSEDNYKDLQVLYNTNVTLYPEDDPVVFTYKVATAPGVETPLRVVTTPTLNFGELEASAYATGGFESDWWYFDQFVEPANSEEETTKDKSEEESSEEESSEEESSEEESSEEESSEVDPPEPN